MKLLLLNTSANTGSTGRIAEEIGLLAKHSGFDIRMAYGRNANKSKLPLIKIGTKWSVRWHGIVSRLFDTHGFASKLSTKAFIKEIDQWKPDIVNIHNLHGYYINIEILFDYLKKRQIPVVWTFHDCWPFTGHCSYFDRYDCIKWQTVCHHCPNSNGYPESWFLDRSQHNFFRKKELFNGLNQMTIVTPSQWLSDHVKNSFLKNYPIHVINNGVNLDQFNSNTDDRILNKYGLTKNPYILGVASVWDKRKGLYDFIALRKTLSNDIKIVLVGLTPKQSKQLPQNIISIPRTESQTELAALYSAASVFVNPTYVDNFPTTNIEALACETPVITYRTGGSPEAVDSETGIVVEKGDIEGLKYAIEGVVNNGKEYYRDKCRERAVRLYNKEDRFNDYIQLFDHLLLKN
jgi:glycosyltransferase involved in cell wall biosynthesis